MTVSSLITDYLGEGTHAARPTVPNVPTGGIAFYYETDTSNTFVWTGTAWTQVNGGGGSSAPSIVQSAGAAFTSGQANTVVMTTAPTNGNLLVAFGDNSSGLNNNPGTGWTSFVIQNSSGVDYATAFWKLAGPSESTSQTYTSVTGTGAGYIYEIHNGAVSVPTFVDSNGSGSFSTVSQRAGGLLIGALCNNSTTDLPTSITGATADSTATNGSNRSIAGFHASSTTAGNNTVSFAYAATHDIKQFGVCVF